MMAKIVKGASFSGVVKYILDPAKQTNLLDADGVRLRNIGTIAQSFEAQRELNPRVSRPVGHISLDFSAQDRDKLTDQIMTRIAHDYMSRMGIVDTQFIIGRHHDKEHPHLHIAFNRIDNQGRTITDKNDRFRSEKICKELTEEYGLYFASGKENVKEHRLKEPDKTKYEIYNALKRAVPDSRSWQELSVQLQRDGTAVEFKMRSGTNEPQGVKFSKNGYHFNGSKVDKQFSYSKIDYLLHQSCNQANMVENSQADKIANYKDDKFTETSDGLTGLFSLPLSDSPTTDPDEEAFRRAMQRKKKKRIRR